MIYSFKFDSIVIHYYSNNVKFGMKMAINTTALITLDYYL